MENAFQSGRAPSSLGEPLLGGISFLCWPMGDPPLSLSLWTPKASPAPGLLPGTLWGASKASAMLTLGAWMGQCQGQVTQERVSEQERVSHCHSEQQESWGLASLAWRSEALLTRPPAPRSLAGVPPDFCLDTRWCPSPRPGQLLAPCWARRLEPGFAHPRRAGGALEASHLTLCTPRASLPDSVTAV